MQTPESFCTTLSVTSYVRRLPCLRVYWNLVISGLYIGSPSCAAVSVSDHRVVKSGRACVLKFRIGKSREETCWPGPTGLRPMPEQQRPKQPAYRLLRQEQPFGSTCCMQQEQQQPAGMPGGGISS